MLGAWVENEIIKVQYGVLGGEFFNSTGMDAHCRIRPGITQPGTTPIS